MPDLQFPYPRKSPNSPALKPPRRSSRFQQYLRRRNRKNLALIALTVLGLFSLVSYLFSAPSTPRAPPGTPEVVLVTTLDPALSLSFKENIKDNRRDYAALHGYATFFPNTTDYDTAGAPQSWSQVPALRHAMTLYPHTPWLWYLASTALIMDARESLQDKLLAPRTLERHMIVGKPVVPPDSVIKTFSHLRGERVDFILTQDRDGLAGGSLLLRSGDWARFFLDAWFDPLYRSYNFQKAESHALEHIVQWHGTILAKLALVPQRLINSYARDGADGVYQDGDFVANFHGCARDPNRDCEEEMRPLVKLRDGERRK